MLTRFPENTGAQEDDLNRAEKAEQFLCEIGFPGARVRIHGEVARIECLPGYLNKMVMEPHRDLIIDSLKKIGFRYISLDLEGYRTGRFNPSKFTDDIARTGETP